MTPRLTNGRHTEDYRVQKAVVPKGAKISRADLADYIVKSLGDARTHQKKMYFSSLEFGTSPILPKNSTPRDSKSATITAFLNANRNVL